MGAVVLKRRALFFTMIAVVVLVACNAILGIDDDVVDPASPDSSALDAPIDGSTSDAVVGDAAAASFEVSPGSITLVQGYDGKLALTTRQLGANLTASLAIDGLPQGVSAQAPPTIPGNGVTEIDLRASPFAPKASASMRIVVQVADRKIALAVNVIVEGPMDPAFGDGGVSTPNVRLRKEAKIALEEGSSTIARTGVGLAILDGGASLASFSESEGTGQVAHGVVVRTLASGALDPSFADAGKVSMPTDSRPQDLVVLDDGRVVVVGADYSPDSGVAGQGPPTLAQWVVDGIAVSAPDHRDLTKDNDETLIGAAVVDGTDVWSAGLGSSSNQTLITTSNPPTMENVATPLASGIKLIGFLAAPPNHVYFIGEASGGPFGKVTRRLADGSIDLSFGPAGNFTLPSATVSSLHAGALQDGGVLFAGSTAGAAGATLVDRAIVVRVRPDGGLEPSFGDGGTAQYKIEKADPVRILTLLAETDGHLLLGGSAKVSTRTYAFFARLTSQGALDPTFGSGGTLLLDLGKDAEVKRLALQSDKKVLAAVVTSTTTHYELVFVRLVL